MYPTFSTFIPSAGVVLAVFWERDAFRNGKNVLENEIIILLLYRNGSVTGPVPEGLNGNAVEIGNSSRCCKFLLRIRGAERFKIMSLVQPQRAGKALKQERVRRPAFA